MVISGAMTFVCSDITAHLSGWLRGKASRGQPRIWVKGKERNSLRQRPAFRSIDEELNSVTAATASRVVMAMLTGGALHTSVPGVAGLPGGYPFVLKRRKFTLHLPSGISSAEAIAHNKTGNDLMDWSWGWAGGS
jgi:hypothetical protein